MHRAPSPGRLDQCTACGPADMVCESANTLGMDAGHGAHGTLCRRTCHRHMHTVLKSACVPTGCAACEPGISVGSGQNSARVWAGPGSVVGGEGMALRDMYLPPVNPCLSSWGLGLGADLCAGVPLPPHPHPGCLHCGAQAMLSAPGRSFGPAWPCPPPPPPFHVRKWSLRGKTKFINGPEAAGGVELQFFWPLTPQGGGGGLSAALSYRLVGDPGGSSQAHSRHQVCRPARGLSLRPGARVYLDTPLCFGPVCPDGHSNRFQSQQSMAARVPPHMQSQHVQGGR